MLERYLGDPSPYRGVVIERADGGREPATMSIGVIRDLAATLEEHRASLTPAEQSALEAVIQRWHAIAASNATAYAAMLRHELRSQIDVWAWYVDDLVAGESAALDDYESEVRTRVRIEGLLAEADRRRVDVVAPRARVAATDAVLRSLLAPAPSRRAAEVAGAVAPDLPWWLCGRPAQRARG